MKRRILSDGQVSDLIDLRDAASRHNAQIVIIGAVAIACQLDDLGRFTSDVDLVIALDLVAFEDFAGVLESQGWTRQQRREHRWTSKRGSLADILPAGPKLRKAGQITWPVSQMTMSLAGFDHVFRHATLIEFAPKVEFPVAPLAVVALLKIFAFLDGPYRRAKDLLDLKMLMTKYEADGDRLFSDEVFAANLTDFDQSNAFLLGLDVGLLANSAEKTIVSKFLDRHCDNDSHTERVRLHFQAFQQGIG